MQHYGIRGVALRYFSSYLENRKQYVSIDGLKSDLTTIVCGVPQGSILGPILFLLYINDLNSVSKILKTIMFADDTNLFLTGYDITTVEQQLNIELIAVNTWFQVNLLSLNVSKTSFIIFSRRRNLSANISINNINLNRAYDTKFLGVILSANLNWAKLLQIKFRKTSGSFQKWDTHCLEIWRVLYIWPLLIHIFHTATWFGHPQLRLATWIKYWKFRKSFVVLLLFHIIRQLPDRYFNYFPFYLFMILIGINWWFMFIKSQIIS